MPKKSKQSMIKSKIKIPYGRQSLSEKDKQAVLKALNQPFLTQGPLVKKFEENLAEYCESKYAVAFNNGTTALHAACIAAGLESHDEGITSPITFAASANCMLYQRAKVKLADIDPRTAQITKETIEDKITKKTKVIIPVDLAGRPSELKEIAKLCQKKNIILINDACHSLGAKYKNSKSGKWKKVGNNEYADMTAFSFHPVKPLTTGEGGAITTNNKKFYERLLQIRHHGITKNKAHFQNKNDWLNMPWYHEVQELGYNYRITDFQCALGISQLKTLNQKISKRKKIIDRYKKELGGIVHFLDSDDETHLSGHHLAVILLPKNKRDQIFLKLFEYGIGTQLHYIPLYHHPYYKKLLKLKPKNFPNAENYFQSALTLPVYPDLTQKEQSYVINSLKKILSEI